MAPPTAVGVAALVGYAVGTFPTAVLVARARGHDVTSEGSGNPGATNVYRVAGRKAGAIVFAGDFAKGAVVTAAALAVAGRPEALAAGAASVVGHCFPITRRLKGGKGVATAAGFASVLEPLVLALAALLWLVVLKATGKASLASLAVAVTAPVAIVAWRGTHTEAAVLGGVAVLVVARHGKNIRRLLHGEEGSVRGRKEQ